MKFCINVRLSGLQLRICTDRLVQSHAENYLNIFLILNRGDSKLNEVK